MLYYLIVGLQLYCAYHAYTTKNNTYWFLVIFLAPGLGSLVYLITQVFTKRDVNRLQQEVVSAINPTKRIRDLEQKVSFLDSFQNKQDLADAYYENNDHLNAVRCYKACLEGIHKEDYYILKQLLKAHYHLKHHNEVITLGDKLANHTDFQKSQERFFYGLSLLAMERNEEAALHLDTVNVRYSNYEERLQLAQMYLDSNQEEKGEQLLRKLQGEFESMSKPSRNNYRNISREVQSELKRFN